MARNRTKRKAVKDTFENTLARLGINSPNLLSATNYPLTRLTRDYNLMNSLYRNSWIAKKIINTIPDDMVKNWYAITAELTPEETDRINKLEQRILLREKVLEGLYWGRLYGGAAAIMMIAGHEDKLEDPLNYDDIMPNSFKGLMVLDRWSGIFPMVELEDNIEDQEFGLPKYYEIRNLAENTALTKIHHSRVVRFAGRLLPYWEDQAEIHWGAAELEHVFDEIAKRDNTSWNIASLIFQANLLVNKVEGMDQMISMGDPEQLAQLYNIKSSQNQMRNNNGMMVIGKDEEMQALNYTFSGINDIYESFMLDVSGAAEIPVTKLFGRSPAGMNSTGESDLQNYYDMISQQQSSVLKPKINKLLPVMFMSELGYIPNDLGIKFNPVQTPTDDKMSDIVAKKVDSLTKAYDSGGINHKMYLRELHELSYTSNMFSSITDEDIERADTEFHNGEMMPDMKGLDMGGDDMNE